MPRSTFTLRGARDLKADLARLRADLDEVRTEVARAWADDVAGTARGLAPVATGRMRRAIEARVDAGSATADGQVGVWEDAAGYARFVEQGTSKMRAQPFLLPAVEAHRQDIPGYVSDAVDRRVR